MLRTLRLRRDDEAGRDMRDAHGGLDFVHVLAALAAGTECVHAKFIRRNDDFAVALLDFRNRVHARETGVAAFVGIERRDAHEAMHAALGLAKTVGVLALDEHRDAFEAGGFAGERVGDLDFPAARFGPARIHARKHFRPVLRFRAARAGVDGEDAIFFVVRAVEKEFQFQRVKFLEKFREVAREFRLDLRLRRCGFGLAEFEHDAEIIELLLQSLERLEFVADDAGLVNEALGFLAVVPEIFVRHQRIQLGETFLQCGDVKETSASA